MRFITGPRQSGKTTLAKQKLKREGSEKLYYLWDLRNVRKRYKDKELFFTQDLPPSARKKHWVCFDEIHKITKWKNILKGVFDETEEHYRFIVTGSSKLDIARKAGDSLSGRYFSFRLPPLTLREISREPMLPNSDADALKHIIDSMDKKPANQDILETFIAFGGFPEPYLKQSKAFLNKWAEDYLDRVIREDIGSLTKIMDRDRIYDIYRILPEMIGSHISENSLASLTESNPHSVKNYLRRLEDFYLCFRVPPYSKNIKRALIKSAKWYLYDWTRIKDEGKRFENYVAVELLSMINLMEEESGIPHRIFYIKDKEKKETDFLILRENSPWMLIEAKLKEKEIDRHHFDHSRSLGDIPLVQICKTGGIAMQVRKNAFSVSAARFFG